MKKTFNLIYYIVFVGALWLMNRHFQNFIAINGVLQGLLVGLVLAFLALLIFKTLTRIILFMIVAVGILVFLISIDFLIIPEWASGVIQGLLEI